MLLYLARHGEAMPAVIDQTKPLTKLGRKEIEKVGNYLKTKNIEVDEIWCSMKKRAVETANIYAESMCRKDKVRSEDGLNPDDPPEPIQDKINAIAAANEAYRIMIVGHLPFLPTLAACLLNRPLQGIEYIPGTIVRLSSDADLNWKLDGSVNPTQVAM